MHIYATHYLKLGMRSEKRKRGSGYSYSHFDKIYATHSLKLGMDQRRKRGSCGYSSRHFDKIYATHWLKLGMDQKKEKEGVVILSHFDKHTDLCNSLPKSWEWIREEKKRERLFL